MTEPLVSEDVARLAEAIGAEPDDVLRDMERRAREQDFPTVGPLVGRWLALLVDMTGAERVFEFGSGFGYSAYWMARALDAGSEVILTEVDPDRLSLAREFFERGSLADRARFESGDAVEIARNLEGTVDVVLLDHEKERYEAAFDVVRERVPPGGLVLADNAVTADPVDVEDVLATLEGTSRPDATAASEGVAAYLRRVRDDEDFETALLPLGEGVAVSRRLR